MKKNGWTVKKGSGCGELGSSAAALVGPMFLCCSVLWCSVRRMSCIIQFMLIMRP